MRLPISNLHAHPTTRNRPPKNLPLGPNPPGQVSVLRSSRHPGPSPPTRLTYHPPLPHDPHSNPPLSTVPVFSPIPLSPSPLSHVSHSITQNLSYLPHSSPPFNLLLTHTPNSSSPLHSSQLSSHLSLLPNSSWSICLFLLPSPHPHPSPPPPFSGNYHSLAPYPSEDRDSFSQLPISSFEDAVLYFLLRRFNRLRTL
uniref:Uncharacterized protein n=1 Tax=Knipowitschia caucasica TaxID=637954 RepID=A0AAV2KS81_KNICA